MFFSLYLTDKVTLDDQKLTVSPAVPASSTDDLVKPEALLPDPEVEKQVLLVLCDLGEVVSCSSTEITEKTSKALERDVNIALVENLLQKFNAQTLIR